MRRLALPLLVAALSAVALSGCAADAIPPTPSTAPAPSATPLFASDAEALAAATKAYAEYLRVSDAIFTAGGRAPERLEQVATGSALETELEGFAMARHRGLRLIGKTTFTGTRIQAYQPGVTYGVVTIYLCVDVSGVDVVDESGKSVVSADRPSLSPIRARFDRSVVAESSLILSEKWEWPGAGVCPSN